MTQEILVNFHILDILSYCIDTCAVSRLMWKVKIKSGKLIMEQCSKMEVCVPAASQ